MNCGKLRYVSDCCAKEWNPLFSKHQDFEETRFYLEARREIVRDGDDLRVFLQDFEESGPGTSYLIEELQEFCQGTSLDDLKSGRGQAGQRASCWLDDRSWCGEPNKNFVREHQNPLTATGLYQILKAPRFNNTDMPDADRRLIYIANLDPAYIYALFQRASFRQIAVLRYAIWKHIAFQTSIRVKIPAKAFPTFQLELHIPYFALRPGHPPRESQWIDLSFLQTEALKSQGQKYGIHRSHISLVMYGLSDRRWVAYAFDRNTFDDKDLEDEMDPSENFQEDPIAKVEADLPIWDPREYFLLTFKTRMCQVLKEWRNLVRWIERSIDGYRNQHSCCLSQEFGRPGQQAEDEKKTYDWTQKTRERLNQLLNVLSGIIKAWETFNSSDGDVVYFSESHYSKAASQHHAHRSLRVIKETFEELEGLQQKLVLLRDSSQDLAKDLELRLTLHSSEAVRHNGLNTELTVTVISPFALATAYCSMPSEVIPFQLSPRSFVVAIFVIMAIVRLLFTVFGAMLRRWKAIQLNRMALSPKTIERFGWFIIRKSRNCSDDVETGCWKTEE